MARESLGEFERLLLMAILHRGDDAYGTTIRDEIEDRTGRSVSLGAMYTALDRLEEKGLVSSWTGGATTNRGGRAKRFYRLNAAGAAVLRESLSTTKAMAKGLEKQLGSWRNQLAFGGVR
jgi:PadR family transcriptional regulator, regulatory protein PadR